MELIERLIRDNMDLFMSEQVRVHVTGDTSRRPASLQDAAREAEEMTRNHSRYHFILATCYSGRWDIVQACRELATKVQDNQLRPEDIDESMLAGHLATNVLGEFACPDLLIRTSGELRLSNFLLWQCAYSELYFTSTMWPDFGEDDDDLLQAEELVKNGLRLELMPQHVAFVMDGNRRWAQARGLTTPEGHEAGGQALRKILELSAAWGIRAITAFAFSLENFRRSQARHTLLVAFNFFISCFESACMQEEVDCVMELIDRLLRDNMDVFMRNGVRVYVTGDPSRLPPSVQDAARQAQEMTRNHSRYKFILATCYSGRWDIVQACRELATKVQDNQLRPEDIDESMLAGHLATNVLGEFACPDLLIRTSGELRLSNFLLWQSAYSELYFTDTLWPDFGEDEYIQALKAFQSRERRFGQRKM
nr:unnamed protein product [Digitaria exilis]